MKIGDKVKCVNANDSNSLALGCEYVIVEINQHKNIQVKERNYAPLSHFYKQSRFKLVEEAQKHPSKDAKKIDLTKEYKTRNGCPVNLFCFSNSPDYPVIGEFFENGEWNNGTWLLSGLSYKDSSSCLDLVEVKDCEEFDCGNFVVNILKDQSVLLSGKGKFFLNEPISKSDMREIVNAWLILN